MPTASHSGSTAYSSQICGPNHHTSGITPYSPMRTRSHAMSSRRRSTRSTTAPANTAATTDAAPPTAVSSPIRATEPVASSTSRGRAISAKESPSTERVWAAQKIPKSRCRHSGRVPDKPSPAASGSPPSGSLPGSSARRAAPCVMQPPPSPMHGNRTAAGEKRYRPAERAG